MITKNRNGWKQILLLCAALTPSVSACSITHEGPQEGTETGNPPVIDVTRVMLVVSSEKVKITGTAGAVSPGGSEVKVQSSLSGMIYSARSASDGSFSIDIEASPADIFELRAADENGDTSKASPIYVSRGSAAVRSEGLTCMQRDNLARAQVGAVAQSADTSCQVDDDCRVQETGTICSDGCNGTAVSTRGASQIEEAREAVANGVCRTFTADGCSILALPCPAPLPSTPRCVSGTCELVPQTMQSTPENMPSTAEPRTGCSEPRDVGTGDAYFPSYWYSPDAQVCRSFVYGGGGGNANRYETQAACEAACKPDTLNCSAPRVSASVCLEGGLAGGCALRGVACALPCTSVAQCAGDPIGSWCAAGYCDATSPE